jgi:hypothetical protein
MTDVIVYIILSLVAIYIIYRVDPEHLEGKSTSIWSFYSSIIFYKKKGSIRSNGWMHEAVTIDKKSTITKGIMQFKN